MRVGFDDWDVVWRKGIRRDGGIDREGEEWGRCFLTEEQMA
jgi:hypothetical protein